MTMNTDTLIKVQDASQINDTRKAELLRSPVEHIDITSFDARPIVDDEPMATLYGAEAPARSNVVTL